MSTAKWLLVAAMAVLGNCPDATSADDTGYFLSMRQKGQLIWRGQIQDNENTWYDVWIVPGYAESFRGARRGFQEAGRSLHEYGEPQKYRDIRRQSRACFDAAWDDCIVDFTVRGTPRAWRGYLGKAHSRVNQRVFGWWMAYPWALMQGSVDNVVRVPVGVSVAVIAVGAGVAGVPAYHATNSGFKAAWIATFDGLLWPANVSAWNTLVGPPLAFLGQKPAPSRVDGFWVRMVEDTTSPDEAALAVLAEWGTMLERQVGPLAEQRESRARQTERQLEALRSEMRRVNQEDSTARATLNETERAIFDSMKALLHFTALLDSLAAGNWSGHRLNSNRDIIKAALAARGLTEEQSARVMSLLERYPPTKSADEARTHRPGQNQPGARVRQRDREHGVTAGISTRPTNRRQQMPELVQRPNIIILYADDLGFGDVGCYGATEIPTPNVDRLAARGIRFTNGYATAATCTPSRYSLLTGSYPWRNPRAAILTGDAPILFDEGAHTLPGMLRRAGYRTGVIGKWHLGLGRGDLDWNRDISATPNDVGFDSSFIMPATNDRVPCVYLENRRVVNLDPNDPIEVSYVRDHPFPGEVTGREHPELLRLRHSHGHDGTIVNGVGRIGNMRGGKSALWTDETMAETFSGKAVEFISTNRDQPFFLYYALHQPHVPRLPNPRFQGATKLGARGDVIVEMDWCVGQVLDALDRLGIREDTIVIFSSDNGPVLDDGYMDRAEELKDGHRPAGPLRGGKYSLFDGGTRVPFILSWPGTVLPGNSDTLVSHVDFCASFAALTGQRLSDDEAPDSCNLLEALLGRSSTGREELVVEGTRSKTVYRRGDWVFIPPYQGPPVNVNTNTELGNSAEPQLYDLSRDIGQIRNVAATLKEQVAGMKTRLEAIRQSNCTRPSGD